MKVALLTFLLFFLPNIKASEIQLHTHMAIVNATVSGAITTPLAISSAINAEVEIFNDQRYSFLFKGTLGMETETGKVGYAYTGAGVRYYIFSDGLSLSAFNDTYSFTRNPKLRYYIGADAGLSHMNLMNFGPTLSSIATMLEFGGHAGATYNISNSWGIDVQGSFRNAISISSFTVNATVINILFGTSYQF